VSSWVRLHFEHLRRWREYAEKICSAVRSLGIGGEVYVVGGVAEDRVTVLSDIDVLVVVDGAEEGDRRRLAVDILEEAIEKFGLPWDAPVELHVASRGEAEIFFKSSRSVKVC